MYQIIVTPHATSEGWAQNEFRTITHYRAEAHVYGLHTPETLYAASDWQAANDESMEVRYAAHTEISDAVTRLGDVIDTRIATLEHVLTRKFFYITKADTTRPPGWGYTEVGFFDNNSQQILTTVYAPTHVALPAARYWLRQEKAQIKQRITHFKELKKMVVAQKITVIIPQTKGH
jgi:hypothetical protein